MGDRLRSILCTCALVLACVAVASTAMFASTAHAQEIDRENPPGNPVVGGEDLTGTASTETNYAPWLLVAGCLIGAGLLLIKIERWEAHRIERAEQTPSG